jgi:glycosyltransferase involved in cell wall biosynthesis
MQSRAENCYLVTHIVNGMPLVTVVTPCYNAEPFIGETIESVQSQAFEDWEHIVVDDGSTDASADIVRGYIDADTTGRLRLHQQANRGVAFARNRGVELASADSRYLLFLDADDILLPDMMRRTADYLNAHRDVALVSVKYRFFDDEQGVHSDVVERPRYEPTRFGLRQLRDDQPHSSTFTLAYGITIPSATLIRRSIFQKTEGFDEDFGQPVEDTDLFMRLSLFGSAHLIPQPLVLYRQHDGQSMADPSHVAHQHRRLILKWESGKAFTDTEHKRRAKRIAVQYKSRIISRIWLKNSLNCLKNHRYGRSAIFLVASLFNYFYYLTLDYFLSTS